MLNCFYGIELDNNGLEKTVAGRTRRLRQSESGFRMASLLSAIKKRLRPFQSEA